MQHGPAVGLRPRLNAVDCPLTPVQILSSPGHLSELAGRLGDGSESAVFAIRYPIRVSHVTLCSPAGGMFGPAQESLAVYPRLRHDLLYLYCVGDRACYIGSVWAPLCALRFTRFCLSTAGYSTPVCVLLALCRAAGTRCVAVVGHIDQQFASRVVDHVWSTTCHQSRVISHVSSITPQKGSLVTDEEWLRCTDS